MRWQFGPWTAALLAEAGPQPGERVLDLAAGTGVVAREAASFVGPSGWVVALDHSPAMLAVGRLLPAPAGPMIEWLEGDAARLPLPDAAFDLVLCQQGLQYFPDRPAALTEVKRVLAPGGRALFAVWRSLEHNPAAAATNAAARGLIGSDAMAAPFALGAADELRTLFAAAGFAGVAVVPRRLIVVFPSRTELVRRNVEGLAAVVPDLAAMDPAERAGLARTIEAEADAVLQAHAWGSGVAAPRAIHLVQASAG